MRHPKHKASETEVIYSTTPARESAPPSCLGWALHTVRGGGRRRMRGTLLTQHWKWQSVWTWGSKAKHRCSDAARFTSRPFVSRREASPTTRSSLREAVHPALVAAAHGEGALFHPQRWSPWAQSWNQSWFDTFPVHLWPTRHVAVGMNTHFLSAGKTSRPVWISQRQRPTEALLRRPGTPIFTWNTSLLSAAKQARGASNKREGNAADFQSDTSVLIYGGEQSYLPPPVRLSRQLNVHKSRKTQSGDYQCQLVSSADI